MKVCSQCDELMEYVNDGNEEFWYCDECDIYVKTKE